MTLLVFNPAKEDGRHAWRDYTWRDVPFVATWKRGAPGRVTAVELYPLARRVYGWHAAMTEAQRETWQAFFRSLGWTKAPFLVRDPREELRVQVALEPAVGDGARVVFSLPTVTTTEDFRYFPLDELASAVGWTGAGAPTTPVAIASIQTEARTLTFAAAPAGGASVYATFVGLRCVRLVEPVEVASQLQTWSDYSLALEEVFRP